MEKFLIEISDNISEKVAKECNEFMPSGHIAVCCTTKDLDYAKSVTEKINTFDYEITFIEYPDDVVIDDESILDIVESQENIRFFIGVGGREIATLLSKATTLREFEYILVSNTPDIYGVGYAIGKTEAFDEYQFIMPKALYIDSNCVSKKEGFASLVGIILGHAVEIFEKEYINKMNGKFEENLLSIEKQKIYDMIGNGDMCDRKKLLEQIVDFCNTERQEFCSSQKVMTKLLEEISLVYDKGDSSLLSAIALIKYFKAILSVEEGSLTIPVDVSSKCRNLAKLSNVDMSTIIKHVEKRKFEPKWLFIHKEYRKDMLDDITKIESKLENIIRSAKRYMSDVGYHLGEEYDSNMLIQAIYNLSPLVEDCSPVSIADCLGIG